MWTALFVEEFTLSNSILHGSYDSYEELKIRFSEYKLSDSFDYIGIFDICFRTEERNKNFIYEKVALFEINCKECLKFKSRN